MKKIFLIVSVFLLTLISLQAQYEDLEMVPSNKIHKKLPDDGTTQGKFTTLVVYNPANERYYYFNPFRMATDANLVTVQKTEDIDATGTSQSIDITDFNRYLGGDITPSDTVAISLTSDFSEYLIYFPNKTAYIPNYDLESVDSLFIKGYGTVTSADVFLRLWGN